VNARTRRQLDDFSHWKKCLDFDKNEDEWTPICFENGKSRPQSSKLPVARNQVETMAK
jgi:hypothetical protein